MFNRLQTLPANFKFNQYEQSFIISDNRYFYWL